MKIKELDRIKSIRPNPRVASAIVLLLLSLVAAVGISSNANRGVYVWAANSQLAVGSQITALDLKRVKVFLPDNSKLYFSSEAKLIGSILIRTVGDGELLPASAIAPAKSAKYGKSVPIKFARNDYPSDITKGTTIDVYALPIREGTTKGSALLIAQGVSIESVDFRGKDIGGEIGVVVKLKEEDVETFLSDTINSKLIAVRSAI